MTLTQRDRRALLILGIGLPVLLILRFAIFADRQVAVSATAGTIPLAEKRLARVRQVAATVPGKDEVSKQFAAELAAREKGMIAAETAAQAQAQLLQVVRRIGKAEGIEVRGGDIGQVRKLGDDYGEVQVTVAFECRIEQLVNFLATLTNEPELLATSEIQIGAANPKEKLVRARITLSGVVPRKLVPEKRGISF